MPLVVIQGSDLHTLDWQTALAGNKDHSSHYNIFPTMLPPAGPRSTPLRVLIFAV